MLATSAHLLHLSLYLQRYVFIFTLSIALQLNSGEIVRKCTVEAHDGGFDGWVYGHERRKSRIARWRLFILHGDTEKFFGSLISLFRSFISFFRTFISALGEEFSFSRELAGISSVGSVIRSQESVFLIVRVRR